MTPVEIMAALGWGLSALYALRCGIMDRQPLDLLAAGLQIGCVMHIASGGFRV